MNATNTLWLALGAAALAVIYGFITVSWVLKRSAGNARMQEIAGAIQEGAKAYMNRQYSTIAIVGVVLFLVLGLVLHNWLQAIGFAVGTAVTGSAGFGTCIALLGGSVGSFAYWLHERLWKAHARR